MAEPFHPGSPDGLGNSCVTPLRNPPMTTSITEPTADGLAPASRARVLIVEDHDVLTHCLSLTLRMEGIEPIVPPSLDDDVVLALTREMSPDVVLLDLNLGNGRT